MSPDVARCQEISAKRRNAGKTDQNQRPDVRRCREISGDISQAGSGPAKPENGPGSTQGAPRNQIHGMPSDMQEVQFKNARIFAGSCPAICGRFSFKIGVIFGRNAKRYTSDSEFTCGSKMKTRAQRQAETAIMELYKTGEIMRACERITQGNQLAQDLAQETMLILLQKPPSQINGMHQRKELRWYTTRLIMILWRGGWSDFSVKYRQFEPILETEPNQTQTQDQEYNHTIDRLIEIMETEMDSWAKQDAYPYDKNLLIEVTQAGSMTQVSKETKIPYRSVVWTIEKAKNKIKKRLKEHGYDSISIDS